MNSEEIIIHMETYRNKVIKVLKDLPDTEKDKWIIWLKMDLEAELGLRKRGEIRT